MNENTKKEQWLAADRALNAGRQRLDAATEAAWHLSGVLDGQAYESVRVKLAYIGFGKLVMLATNVLNVTHSIGSGAQLRAFMHPGGTFPLTRALLETFCSYFHLAIEDVDAEERELRVAAMDVHAANRFDRLLRSSGAPDSALTDHKTVYDARKTELSKIPKFSMLQKERQDSLLRGWYLPFDLKRSAVAAGISASTYEFHHTLYSDYVHGGPISIATWLTESQRGDGQARMRASMGMSLDLSAALIETASDFFVAVTPQAREAYLDPGRKFPKPFWRE